MQYQKMIDYKDISVVVNGLIVGKAIDKPENRYTKICLESIRKYLPGSHIILSTWKGSDVSGLDYDTLVESDDPGESVFLDLSSTGFRQVTSCLAGLKQVKTKYALKMRTDLLLTGNGFLKYFKRYSKLPSDPKYRILTQRVAVLTTCNPRRKYKFPYNTSDWFYFGKTEDLINIFDIPLIKTPTAGLDKNGTQTTFDSPYSVEQFIWFSFLSKYKQIDFKRFDDVSGENIELSEKYFANNTIMLPARKAGVNWLKYPGAAYAQIPCLSNSGLYTWNEYKKILNKYTDNKLIIIPNPIESLIYATVYPFRFWLKEHNKWLHDKITHLVNRENHQRVEKNLNGNKTRA